MNQIYVSTTEAYTGFAVGDSIVFADEVIVRAEDNKLQGLIQGSTYVLVRKASDDMILAYKMIVK